MANPIRRRNVPSQEPRRTRPIRHPVKVHAVRHLQNQKLCHVGLLSLGGCKLSSMKVNETVRL